jgi:hypothetical protein
LFESENPFLSGGANKRKRESDHQQAGAKHGGEGEAFVPSACADLFADCPDGNCARYEHQKSDTSQPEWGGAI